MKQLKIIFMGTSDFAVFSLKKLIKESCNISLVATQPDRKKGRGKKLLPPPVKTAALKANLNIIQPETIADKKFEETIKGLAPDLLIVTSFGHILKKPLLDIPSIGAINIHASLLPKYRGASPIHSAIINREKETGVTTIFMDEGVDTGNIINSVKIAIKADDTAATLHDKLGLLGADLLIKTLKQIAENNITSYPQNNNNATYTRIFKKKDGNINWNKPAKLIEAFIRGMNPWPSAFTYLNDKRFKIFKAKVVNHQYSNAAAPGTVIYKTAEELLVSTQSLALSILEIQADSGKKLKIKNFLSGFAISEDAIFSGVSNNSS